MAIRANRSHARFSSESEMKTYPYSAPDVAMPRPHDGELAQPFGATTSDVESMVNLFAADGEMATLATPSAGHVTLRRQAEEVLLKAGALQKAIFNSANFSCIATDATGVIQIFNVG